MQVVHLVPPSDASLSVAEPWEQFLQLASWFPLYIPGMQAVHATFESAVAWPAEHAVHASAAKDVPVLVIEPAVHLMHCDTFAEPGAATYIPPGQPLHAESVGLPELSI
jgi:hypothetical protein